MAKFLLVDDSSMMRRNLRSLMESEGHEVAAEMANGRDLIDMYRQHKPDVVTLDIGMPLMDGITALKSLISEFPDAKVIMISAFDQRNKVLEAIKLGAKAYLLKPIVPENVMESIRQVLEQDWKVLE